MNQPFAPFSGVKVLDLTRSIAGPWTTRMLADAGAEVVKVEPPGGDFVRHLPARTDEGMSGYFANANAGKRSICIDLQRHEGRELLKRLIPHFDVFVHNMRPLAAARLGLSPDFVAELNPRAIFLCISGYGDAPRFIEKPGQDLAIQCLVGLSEITGEEGGEPVMPVWSLVDTLTSAYAFAAISAARLGQIEKGESCGPVAIAVSMSECAARLHDVPRAMLAMTGSLGDVRLSRTGRAHPNLVYRAVVPCRGGDIAISAYRRRDWARFAELLGSPFTSPTLLDESVRRGWLHQVDERVATVFEPMEWSDALALLHEAGVPAAYAPSSLEEALEGDHARDAVAEGAWGGCYATSALFAERSRQHLKSGPPALGEASFDVLHGMLGMSGDEILQLLYSEVIACAPAELDELLKWCTP
jgi:formyl-CoA transferase